MPQIDVQPLVLKDVILTVGTDDYEKHVSSVTFTPATSAVTWRGLTPDAVFTDPGSVTWTCVIEAAQDWDTPDSLSRFLFENEGSTVTMTFQPRRGEGVGTATSFEADVTIIPGSIGGAVNAYSTSSVTLGVQGRPRLLEAGAGATGMATTSKTTTHKTD